MKKVLSLFIIAIACTISVSAQDVYKYYFFEVRPTGKLKVELAGNYPETDKILVESVEVSKKGDTSFVYKKFASYSEAFNALSALGLEFVEFRNLPLVGGATRLLTGDVRIDWLIWRKKVN